MRRILNRLFQREEMDGDGRCPTYLVRWTLLKLPNGRGIYLHHFLNDDWSLDRHDHPKRFISVGLRGGYVEEIEKDRWEGVEVYNAPWIRTFPAAHRHRLLMFKDRHGRSLPCWTLVIVLKNQRRWGFWHAGKWIPWRDYVNSETATEMKSCGD